MRMIPLYIDVAVMSATIEAIVGVVIAVSAFLIIRFRKAKKKVQETLHLEDTKETEEEVVLLDDEIVKTAAEAADGGAESFDGGPEIAQTGPEESTGA